MLQPLFQPILRPLLRGLFDAGYGSAWDPRALYRNGEQGVWYDPSDITTMYLDIAGTTPVAPVGTVADQPVGRILDKSGRGIHATQPTSTARPLLSARVNLLTKTEDLSGWSIGGAVTATPNYGIAPDGSTTAIRVQFSAVGQQIFLNNLNGGGKPGVASIQIKGTAGETIQVVPDFTANNIITLTGSWQTVVIYSAVANAFSINTYSAVTARDIQVWHPQFEAGSTATATPYQRVKTASDYDAVGFPHYLKFDGIDDSLSTGSIDFTSTDKMSVFAGVRKLSDAGGYAIIAELGVTTPPGSIGIFAPYAPGTGSYAFNSAGTTGQSAIVGTGYSAPVSNVLTCVGDISGDVATLRINGTQAATTSANQGTGNFGNYPLYIGRRGGTSLSFNGNLYGLVLRGSLSTEAEITSTEKFVAGKTGVTLP
jgi:Concanavalin A-like lectin/glucanases superfamily